MRLSLLLLLISPAFAKLTIEDLKTRLEQGAKEAELLPLIQKEGIDFPINLKTLKKMKKAEFPDFLIDGLIEFHGPHRVSDSPSRNSEGASGPVDEYPYLYSNFPFYGFFNPYLGYPYSFYYNSLPYFFGLSNFYGGFYSPFWGSGYWGAGYWGSGYWDYQGNLSLRGNRLSPNGFSNSILDRVRGHAVSRSRTPPKANRTSAISSSTQGRRSSIGSQASPRSASPSSSSGGKATRK